MQTSEEPVVAAHSPKTLQDRCLEYLISIILNNAFPCSLYHLVTFYDAPVVHHIRETEQAKYKDPRRLDIVLMCTEEREPSFITYKTDIMEKLQKLKAWFSQPDWLGGPNSEIRRRIRSAMSEELQLIDPYSIIPLFRFLIESLFSCKVGGCSDAAQFPLTPRVKCELWRKDCPLFSEVLESFAPFDIEELSTHHLVFGGPQPLLVIVENSPFLKRVYLRNNICEELLIALGQHCPLIDTFHMKMCMGELMVPVNCLYKTFFQGMDYNAIMTLLSESPHLEKQKYLSFPHLKSINLGKVDYLNANNKKDSLFLFIHVLLYFYSHSINVTSDISMPFSPALPEDLPPCLHNISYKVQNLSLNGIQKYLSNSKLKESSEVILPVETVYQLTFSHRPNEDEEMQDLVEFSKVWIPKLGCKTLFIYTLHDADHQVNISSFYTPLFAQIGATLISFHFNIVGDISLSELCDIISLCPNLEILRLRLTKVHSSSVQKLSFKKLSKLTSLTIHSVEDFVPEVHEFIENLIVQSPFLNALSLVLHDKPCEWLMSLATSKKLNGIHILRLSFHCFNFTCREMTDFLKEEPVGVAFYVFLIELLASLKVLELGCLSHITFRKLIQIYRKYDLRISIWNVPSDSREWYGGYVF